MILGVVKRSFSHPYLASVVKLITKYLNWVFVWQIYRSNDLRQFICKTMHARTSHQSKKLRKIDFRDHAKLFWVSKI